MMNRMKKTMKRTLATVLTLAMVLAMLPAGPVRVFAVATQLTDPNLQYFTGDDFNDSEAFKANWNIDPATVKDQWNISDKYPTGWECISKAEDLKAALATVEGYDANTKYFDEREGTGNTFLAFRNFNNNLPNNTSATPVKWTAGNKPLEYEFDFRAPISNLTTGEFPSVSIPIAMSGENNANYFYISVGSPDSGHGYKSHLSIMPYVTGSAVATSGFGGNGNKLIVPAWGQGSNQVYASGYSWTHIKAVYDYSQWTDAAKTVAITVTATVVKTTTSNKGTPNLAGTETYTNTRTYTVTFPEGTETITIGFVPGTSAGHINIDNMKVTSTAQKAQEFYNTYSGFLGQDPETMTNSDFDAFTAMYNAWAVLDDQSKAMLADSGINQALVDSFAAAFASLCGNLTQDGFESAFKTEQWWNNVDGTVAKLADTYQNASNATVAETDNSFLKITSASNATGKWVTPKNWAEGERPTKLSFKFRREYSNSGAAYLYFAYDPVNSYGAGLQEWNDGGTNQPTIRARTTTSANSGYSPSDNSSKILSFQNAHNNYVTTYDQWITIEAVYDWSTFDTDGKLKITYSIPEIGGNQVSLNRQTITYTFANYATAPTLYPAFYTDGSSFDIDDVVIETNAQAAREFYNTYNDFLSRDPGAMTSSDFDAFTAMYNAWAALDDQSKAMLAGSGINQALVDSFAAVFASLCGRLESDDFSDTFRTENWWNNVDGTNAYVQDGVLVITPNTNTNTAAYVTPKVWAEGERPTKLTFDYKDTDSTKAGAIFAFAYSPNGAGAESAYGGGLFAYTADGGTSWHNLGSWIPGKISTSGDQSDRFIAKQYGGANSYGIADTSWITIEGVYDWSNYDTNGKVKVTYDITHVNGVPVELNSKSFTYTFSNYANVKTLYPAFLSTSTTYCIDNVVIETNAKAANAYKETYGEFLAKESVTVDDLNDYLAAYDAYNAVDASSKAFLTAEKAKLDAFKSQFDALYADEKLSNIDFDSGFIADQFFETTGGSVSYADSKVQIPSGVSYALKSGRLEGKPQSMSFNFCYPTGSSKLVLLTEGGKTAYIDFGGTMIRVYSDSGITQNPAFNGSKLLSCESGMSIDYVDRNWNKAAVWDRSQMITLTANYDYSQWDSNIIKVSFDIKFYGYNFRFDENGSPIDMNNANGTYTPGWVEHRNIQTITFTFENVENVKFEPKFVSSGTTQVDKISATYRDEQMETLLNSINSLVITPATFDDLAALKQQYAESGKDNAAVEAALAAKQAEVDALHPTTLGGTIKTTNNVRKQNLKILSGAPTAAAPEGFTVSRIGVLFLPANMLTGELTVNTDKVANGSKEVTSVPDEFSGELTNSALDATRCGMEFATRCYVVYTDGNTEYYVYGETITRSIYGIAKKMANAVLAKAQSDAAFAATVAYTEAVPSGTANVDNVANEDVLAFITANVSAVNALS